MKQLDEAYELRKKSEMVFIKTNLWAFGLAIVSVVLGLIASKVFFAGIVLALLLMAAGNYIAHKMKVAADIDIELFGQGQGQ